MASVKKLRRIARSAARKYGIDPDVFERQINAESGFQTHVTSSAGARGIAQFMPGTARSEGVNPNNPRSALKGAARLDAKLIRQTGSYRKALAAYNAGPGNIGAGLGYADKILAGRNPKGHPNPGASSSTRTVPGVDRSDERKRILAEYILGQSGIQVPDQTDPLAQAQSGQDLTSTLLRIAQTKDTPSKRVSVSGSDSSAGAGVGKVSVRPGADRPGARTRPRVIHFAEQVAGVYGHSLTVGTGTNHSRLTVNGNVSDHWAGNAVDIPASGAALTRLGQAALIAAGMPASKARRQHGGLFNVGGHQIIFNTNQGGNHYNHLHISAR